MSVWRVGLLVALVFGGGAQAAPDPHGERALRRLMQGDARGWVTGAQTFYDWSSAGVPRVGIQMSVAAIRREFDANAVAAERRFAQPLLVTGTLRAVDRVPRGIAVRFQEGGSTDRYRPDMRREMESFGLPFVTGAQAVMHERHAEIIATWRPGASISLVCAGAANSRIALLLDDCEPLEGANSRLDALAVSVATALLTAQPVPIPPVDGDAGKALSQAILMYARAKFNRCADQDEQRLIACINREPPRGRPRMSAEFLREAAGELGYQPTAPAPR